MAGNCEGMDFSGTTDVCSNASVFCVEDGLRHWSLLGRSPEFHLLRAVLGLWSLETELRGKAPKRCSTFSAVNKSSHLDISITIGVPFDFSSDLSSGRRPMSISDEK